MKPGADKISDKAQGDHLPAATSTAESAAAIAAINDAHCSGACQRSTERPAELKRSLDSRLARIEGQVRGLRRLVEQDAYCDDVLAQVAAARSALANAALLVLEHHMHHCLIDRLQSGDDSIIDELMTTFKRMV